MPGFGISMAFAISISFCSRSSSSQTPTMVLSPFSAAIAGISSLPSLQEKERIQFTWGWINASRSRICAAPDLRAGTLAFDIRAKRHSMDLRLENFAHERTQVVNREPEISIPAKDSVLW